MEGIATRNITLDYFKIFLTILVILAHMVFSDMPALTWGVKYGVSRIAVPCFFIINGFFLANIINDGQKMKKYFGRLVILYAVWMAVYFGFYADYTIYGSGGFSELFLLLFRGFYHLWYVAALIVAAFLLWMIRNINYNILLVLAIVIFLVGCLISQSFYLKPLGDVVFGFIHPNRLEFCINNFLFMGFPFLIFGYYINKCNVQWNKLTDSTLLILIILSFIILGCELFLMRHLMIMADFFVVQPTYVSLLFICPLLFVYIQRIGTYREADDTLAKLASGIYFIHPLVLFTLGAKFSHYSFFMLIFFISVLLSFCLIAANKRIKMFL